MGTIQQRVPGKDSTGAPAPTYTDWAVGVRFAIDDFSTREQFLAQQVGSELTTRIRTRWRPGVKATMRLLHQVNPGQSPAQFDVYDIQGVVRDVTLRVEMQLVCKLRDAAGFLSGPAP